MITNLTRHAVAHTVGIGVDGCWQLVVAVKATFTWDDEGNAKAVAPVPFVETDQFAGAPDSSGLLRAAEIGPKKPRVDVLLAGALSFSDPVTEVDSELVVGARLRKCVRVFGDRVWARGVVVGTELTRPFPVSRVPIAWERSYGGFDPEDPARVDLRNPAGSGAATNPAFLEGRPAPNFEDPKALIGSAFGRPSPVGFGPAASHWQPRIGFAGTYDETWASTRRPLPPVDFDPRYFNVAPIDQQIDGYTAGELVHLVSMTVTGHDRWRLPAFSVPVASVTAEEFIEGTAEVDTIVIEPEGRRFSLVARAQMHLSPDPTSLSRIVVGHLSRGRRTALERGKRFIARGRRTPS
jgi:hypothetical protein